MKSLTVLKKVALRLATLLILSAPVASEAAFSRADLSGTWNLFIFFDHPSVDDPGWNRGTISFNASGTVTGGSLTANDGAAASFTGGSLAVNHLGVFSGSITMSNGATATYAHGKIDKGKNVATFVGTDSDGYRFKGSAIKAGGSFVAADMQGTWHFYNFIGVPAFDTAAWTRGTVTINSSGTITGGSFLSNAGAVDNVSGGSFSINSAGVFSATINFASGHAATLTQGKADSGKTIAAYVGTDNGPGAPIFSGLAIKETGSFANADRSGRWQYHSFWDDPTGNDPGWDRGAVVINTSGTATGERFSDSDGASANLTGGSFSINGIGVYSGSLTFNSGVTTTVSSGKMSASKTIATYVSIDSQGFVSQGTALKIGAGILDFDDDGKSDVGIYRDGLWAILRSSDSGTTVESLGGASHIAVPADYDGDGKNDIAVYLASTGIWSIKRSSDGVTTNTGFGGPAFTPVPADYDGDGKADIAVFSGGVWSILRSSDGVNTVIAHGGPGWTPVPGDYDGDGKADAAVYINGAWSIKRSSDNAIAVSGHGGPTWIPVPGDYDGDGKTDIAVYTVGAWSVLRSSDSGNTVIGHGGPTWEPVAADYDGDGKTDIAVHQSGAWSIKRSSDNGITVVAHGGGPTDVPLN